MLYNQSVIIIITYQIIWGDLRTRRLGADFGARRLGAGDGLQQGHTAWSRNGSEGGWLWQEMGDLSELSTKK